MMHITRFQKENEKQLWNFNHFIPILVILCLIRPF